MGFIRAGGAPQTRYRHRALASREVWKRRLGPLFGGAVALASSSSLVLPGVHGAHGEEDAPAAGWVLAVGAAIGMCAYGVAALGHALGLPPAACTSVAVVIGILLGGVVVERGLGVYLSRNASGERSNDSAIAATAIAGSLLVRTHLLAAIPYSQWLWAFPATWLVGRWAAMFLQAIGDPILDPPPRSLVASPPPAWVMGVATAVVAVGTVVALGWGMLLAVGLTASISFALGLIAQRRRGGIDAAVVGAAAAAGEVVTLLVLAASW
jgi:cobalamin synthase